MPDRSPPDERLRYLLHLDRRLHPRVDVLLLQSILQGQCVDNSGEHAHVIRGNAVHVFGLLRHAAEKVPPANDNGQLHP